MADIWISGPVTGHADLNRPAFEALARKIYQALDETTTITIPHDIVPPDASHEEAMDTCLTHILDCSVLVVMLPGWEASMGATLERAVAKACGIPVLEMTP